MSDASIPLNPPTSRREFAKTALAAVAVPVLAPLAGCSSPPAPAPSPVPAETTASRIFAAPHRR